MVALQPNLTSPDRIEKIPAAMRRTPPAKLGPHLPLLITGITGVAGYNAFYYFQKRYPGQVVGVRSPQSWRLDGEGIVALAAENSAGLRELFAMHRFRSVLNCVGNCALKSCELD